MLGRSGFGWMGIALLLAAVTAQAGERTPLSKGDAAPEIAFDDITGEARKTSAYDSWIQVLSFADRESSETLKEWMRPAQLGATSAHPEMRVVYITFADLTAVPRFLRGMVRPVLEKTFENSNEDLVSAYRKIGVEPSPDKVELIFAPDWDGAHLETFGLDDATTYYVWIVVDGRVVEALDASTTDLEGRYRAAFDAIAATESAQKGSAGSLDRTASRAD